MDGKQLKMDSKGQVSAEFLFLILIILIIITAVTIPLLANSISAGQGVSQVSDADSAMNDISDAVNIVYANGPGARRTLSVYIPQATTLTSSGNVLRMTLTGISYKDSNGNPQTSKTVTATTDYTFATPVSVALTKGWNNI